MKKLEPGADRAATTVLPPVEVLELSDIGSVAACVELQRSVWQAAEVELVPVSQMRAAQHAGGLLAGARINGALVGFSYGFPAYRPEVHYGPGLHSHMTGVVASVRSRGVGRALKAFQRSWCLERGIRWVEWTFDPLRATNARFNLEHLGASADEYLVDTYGQLEDGLNAGLPSDRLMATWILDGDGNGNREPAESALPVLTADEKGQPNEPRLGETAKDLAVAIPSDLDSLLAGTSDAARAWRHATRTALDHYLGRGYRAVRFIDGAYRLKRK